MKLNIDNQDIVDKIIKIFAENNFTIDEANKILYTVSKQINQQVVQVF